ncbi:MAG: hypothetical protein R2681_16545 [Pyrinomonadaceae bacterium]
MSLFKDLIDELKEENLLEETIEEHLAKNVDDNSLSEEEDVQAKRVDLNAGDPFGHTDSDNGQTTLAAENFTSVEMLDYEPLEPSADELPETSFRIIGETSDNDLEFSEPETTAISVPEPEALSLESMEPSEAEPEFPTRVSAEETVQMSGLPLEEPATAPKDILPIQLPDLSLEGSYNETEKPDAAEDSEESEGESDQSVIEEESAKVPETKDPVLEKAEYAQRLIDNVRSLQHVQHILSGVQREQMREKPVDYDTVPVKQALHKFVDAVENSDEAQCATTESRLHEEIGKWHSVLSSQDRKTSVAHLRRYCEDTNPPLSSEAVSSMARFYRNSPFNEDVRSKFDLVVTRLFSKKIDGDKRQALMHRDQILERVKVLYADWASVSLYNDENEDSDIILAAFKFEDFVAEVNKVKSFDELIRNGFFKRIKNFKEKLQENFFSPLLIAVAVECNVSIGNRYIDLINSERKKVDERGLRKKRGKPQEKPSEIISKLEDDPSLGEAGSGFGGVTKTLLEGKRKWFTGAALASFLLMISLFAFGSFTSKEAETASIKQSEDGAVVNLDRSSFSNYIESARIKQDVFIGVTTSAWDNLPYAKKEELLKKIQLAGADRGYTQVQLSNNKGESRGFGSESGINVIE